MERDDQSAQGQTSTPRPDPTERTKQELLREITHLRELLEAKLAGHVAGAETRHDATRGLLLQQIEAVDKLFGLHLEEARTQLNARISDQQAATAAALESTTLAVDKAEKATEKRFEAVNEFREQLSDQSLTFLRREMFDQHVRESQETKQTLQAQIEANTRQLLTLTASETGGRDREAQARANLASVLAVLATLVAVATLIVAVVGA